MLLIVNIYELFYHLLHQNVGDKDKNVRNANDKDNLLI